MQKIPQLQLAVVGDETQSPFPAMSQKMGLADRVRFLGYRRDVPRLMRTCDMFVFPSRYEACSLALLEALASGLPVISAKTAGGSELISPAVRACADRSGRFGWAGRRDRAVYGSRCPRQGKARGASGCRATWLEPDGPTVCGAVRRACAKAKAAQFPPEPRHERATRPGAAAADLRHPGERAWR